MITRFTISPNWTIIRQGEELLLSAGADMEYSHHEKEQTFFEKTKKPFTRKQVPKKELVLFEQLLNLGVIVPVMKKKNRPTYAVIGDESDIDFVMDKISNSKTPDILIIVKRTSSYTELLSKVNYQELSLPHILLDVSTHHTLSLGPLVFPGETACIACLQGRIEQRWGSLEIAAKPRVWEENKKLAESLLENEVVRAFTEDYSLVNTTFTYDIASRKAETHKLVKTSFCPICSANTPMLNKSIVLSSKI